MSGLEQDGWFVGKLPTATRPTPQRSYEAIDDAAVIADFGRRLANMEKGMRYAVQGDRVLSQIAISPEAILIQSDRIGLLGEVTFADWHRDISGNPTGTINPSITQIRGGVIRTGQVVSKDGQSWLDLDATGADAFLKCRSAARINADGTFSFGGTAGKQLVWNGTDLTIGGSSYLGSSTVSSVVSGANRGASLNVANELTAITNASSEVVIMNKSELFKSSNSSQGVFIGAGGIYAKNASGVVTFTLNGTTGSATFAGDVSTQGYVYAAGNSGISVPVVVAGTTYNVSSSVYAQNSETAVGSNVWTAGLISQTQTTGKTVAVLATADSGISSDTYGVVAVAVGGIGAYFQGDNHAFQSSGRVRMDSGNAGGVVCAINSSVSSNSTTLQLTSTSNADGNYALDLVGRMKINNTSLVANLNAQYLSGNDQYYYLNLSNAIGQSSFAFSQDGGASWNNILLKKV